MTEDTALLRRFLNTVRVAAHTALAEYELDERRGSLSAPVRFHALAAKGVDGWRFPEAGLTSADGLVAATVERDGDGAAETLLLQAQGSAGLDGYAGRRVRIDFGALAPEAETRFDVDGRAVVALAGLGLDEDDLSTFTIELVDAR